MALEQIVFNIASFNDADAGGNNYYAGAVYEIYNTNDTLADIFSDAAGANPIIQDGISNVSDSTGKALFYIEKGTYYGLVNGERRDIKTSVDSTDIINNLSLSYVFDTVADMVASAIAFPVGKRLNWQGYYTQSDGGSNWGIVTSGAHTDDGGSTFTLADGKYVAANTKGTINILSWGCKEFDITEQYDNTTQLNKLFSFLNTAYFNGAFETLSKGGGKVKVPSGDFLVRDTLFVGSSLHLKGNGWASKFRFDPTVSGTDFMNEYNKNVASGSGTATARSCVSILLEDFQVYCDYTGATVTAYAGNGTVQERNRNSRHAIHLSDTFQSNVNRVLVLGFWQGTAFYFERKNEVFTYYNHLTGCRMNDNKLDASVTSGSTIKNCTVGTAARFPADTIGKDYCYDLQNTTESAAAAGVAITGGSIEGYFNIACIKDSSGGTVVSGLYTEAIAPTSVFIDARNRQTNAGGSTYQGNHHGYSGAVLLDRDNTGTGSNFTAGVTFDAGDAIPVNVINSKGLTLTARGGQNFNTGHFPTNGLLFVTQDDTFCDEYSMKLQRDASSNSGDNQMSIACIPFNPAVIGQTVYCTIAVKSTDNSDTPDGVNWDMNLNAGVLNNKFKPIAKYSDGWNLYSTQFSTNDDTSWTILINQLSGATSTQRTLTISTPRFYVNGYKITNAPVDTEVRLPTVPTAGRWTKGERVFDSSPGVGQPQGWVCTASGDFAGSAPTFANMPPL